jgi:hypothetical protein
MGEQCHHRRPKQAVADRANRLAGWLRDISAGCFMGWFRATLKTAVAEFLLQPFFFVVRV